MEKVLAILLAMVMVCSMSVFAFAAETEQTLDKTTTSGDVVIKTKTTDDGGNDAKKYSVIIPADTEIAWDTETTNLVYKVEAHLGHGEAVKVTVAGSGTMSYVADETTTYPLAYTLGGDKEVTEGPVVYPAADKTVTVGITEDDWNKAVVGEYSDILTFTTEIAVA